MHTLFCLSTACLSTLLCEKSYNSATFKKKIVDGPQPSDSVSVHSQGEQDNCFRVLQRKLVHKNLGHSKRELPQQHQRPRRHHHLHSQNRSQDNRYRKLRVFTLCVGGRIIYSALLNYYCALLKIKLMGMNILFKPVSELFARPPNQSVEVENVSADLATQGP